MNTLNTDVKDNKLIAAAGYLWILCLLPLLAKKDSRFAQFHGKQGLVLFALSIALWIVGWFPLVGWLIWFGGWLLLTALSIIGLVKALQGQYWEMPLLGQYAKKIVI